MTKTIAAIRETSAETGAPIAVFADLQGPKIRTGAFKGEGLDLKYGAKYRLRLAPEASDADVIPIPHKEVFAVLKPGDVLKLDDGKLQLTIETAGADGGLRAPTRRGSCRAGRASIFRARSCRFPR